jgi:hypothetical protein
MAKAKPIDETTIDNPALWMKAATRTRHVANFLNATRVFLVRHCGEKVKAVFAQLDYNKIDSTTAIQAIYDLLFSERGQNQREKGEQERRNSNWSATIYGDPTAVQPVNVVCCQFFGSEKEATGFLCRYLTNHGASTWYGILTARDEKTQIRIDRDLAMGMLLNPMKHPTAMVKQVKISATRLSWGVGGQFNKPYYRSLG